MVSTTLATMLSDQVRDIHIVPFTGVEPGLLEHLAIDLEDAGFAVRLESPQQQPASAYHAHKRKYFADSMLDYLRIQQGGRVLGVMSEDLYRYVIHSIKGMADFVGRAAVISLCQFCDDSNKTLLRQRLCKLALHELGHTFGLEHCDNQCCVMHDGEGLALWDRAEDEFCCNCCQRLAKSPYLGFL